MDLTCGGEDLSRCQAAACAVNDTQIVVLGGVNKAKGGYENDALLVDTEQLSVVRTARCEGGFKFRV